MSIPDHVSVQEEAIALLTFSRLEGVGYWGLRRLCEAHESLRLLLKALPSYDEVDEVFHAAGIRKRVPRNSSWEEDVVALWNSAQEQYKAFRQDGVTLLVQSDQRFPSRLKEIPDAPYWLFVEGAVEALERRSIAIVGTRKPSADGEFLCEYVTRLASMFDCTVVSGLAMGIDQIAHERSLSLNRTNIAVMGTGIGETHPKGAIELRRRIVASGGAVVSEYLPNQRYSRENFVRRNRIQAALSSIVVPVEWSEKSGTAHTVRFASEYGKCLVFVGPSPRAEGEHWLETAAETFKAQFLDIPGGESALSALLAATFSNCESVQDEDLQGTLPGIEPLAEESDVAREEESRADALRQELAFRYPEDPTQSSHRWIAWLENRWRRTK